MRKKDRTGTREHSAERGLASGHPLWKGGADEQEGQSWSERVGDTIASPEEPPVLPPPFTYSFNIKSHVTKTWVTARTQDPRHGSYTRGRRDSPLVRREGPNLGCGRGAGAAAQRWGNLPGQSRDGSHRDSWALWSLCPWPVSTCAHVCVCMYSGRRDGSQSSGEAMSPEGQWPAEKGRCQQACWDRSSDNHLVFFVNFFHSEKYARNMDCLVQSDLHNPSTNQ
jgi:hypothetical protein